MEKGQQSVWLISRFPCEKDATGKEHEGIQTTKPECGYLRKKPGNRFFVSCFLPRLFIFIFLLIYAYLTTISLIANIVSQRLINQKIY